MKNVTFSIDEETLRRARLAARSLGKSVNQLMREYLAQLGSATSVEEEIDEFNNLSEQSRGRSRGWEFDREEIHERG